MITFKDFFEEMSKNNIQKISRGHEFGMVGAGKSGLMKADRKDFKRKKERKDGKSQAKKAMRGEY